jgi:hypothetical protein
VWIKQPKGFLSEAFIDTDGTISPTFGECKGGIGALARSLPRLQKELGAWTGILTHIRSPSAVAESMIRAPDPLCEIWVGKGNKKRRFYPD